MELSKGLLFLQAKREKNYRPSIKEAFRALAIGLLATRTQVSGEVYNRFPDPVPGQCSDYWLVTEAHQLGGVTSEKLGLVGPYEVQYRNLCSLSDYDSTSNTYTDLFNCPEIDPSLSTLRFNSTSEMFIARDAGGNHMGSGALDISHRSDFSCAVSRSVGTPGFSELFNVTAENGGFCQITKNDLTRQSFLGDTASTVSVEVKDNENITVESTYKCWDWDGEVQSFQAHAGAAKSNADFKAEFLTISPTRPEESVTAVIKDIAPYEKQFVIQYGTKKAVVYDRLDTKVSYQENKIKSDSAFIPCDEEARLCVPFSDKRNGAVQYTQTAKISIGQYSNEFTTHYPTLETCLKVEQNGDDPYLTLVSNSHQTTVDFGDILVERAEIHYAGKVYNLDQGHATNTFNIDTQIPVETGNNVPVELKAYNAEGLTVDKKGVVQNGASIRIGETNQNSDDSQGINPLYLYVVSGGLSIMLLLQLFNRWSIQDHSRKIDEWEEKAGLLTGSKKTTDDIGDGAMV